MTEHQKVQAEGYSETMVRQLGRLRSNKELCDFKVSAEGQSFEVHKVLLAATSDYFRVMFSGVMAESRQNSVELKGVTADGLQHILDFIYSGEMTLHYDNLTETINTASHLQVSCALDLCSTYIKSLMTFDNAEEFLAIADTYSLESVQYHWDSMILNNFYEFSGTQAYLKLDAASLTKYLSQNSLRVTSEFKLFQCLDKWFKYAPSRYAEGTSIIKHIRYGLMTEAELTVVQDSELIKKCQGSVQYVMRGIRYHSDCKDGHPVIEEICTVRSDIPSLTLVHHGSAYMPFQITAHDHVSGVFFRLFSDVNGSRDCRLAVVDNFAYICRVVDFGGGTLMSSLVRFDPRHLCSHELRPMRRLRMEFALVSYDGCIFAFGGTTDQFLVLDSVECYNVASNLWNDLPQLPLPLHSLAAAVHGEKIYLSGGILNHDRQTTNSFMCYFPQTRQYENLPGMFYARRLHDMVSFQEKIYVVGGIPRQGVPLQGQIPIECYNFGTRQWTMLSSSLSGRSVGHYLSFEGQILSLGHEHQNATEDEIWTYDPELDDWNKYAKAPQRMNLTSAICSTLFVNFNDEKVRKTFLKEK